MSRNYFHIHHVESSALLPEKLTPGTAYFVDDEQYIVVDYGDGRGPITYGGTISVTVTGGAGNSGFVQEQLNTLAGGVLALEKVVWDETQYIRQQLTHIATKTDEEVTHLEDLSASNAEGIIRLAEVINTQAEVQKDALAEVRRVSNANAEGILNLAATINDQANKTNAALSILTKAVTDIYEMLSAEPALTSEVDYGDNDPLDNDIVETDAGSWVIQQTINPDGSMTFELEAITLPVETLNTGDTISYGGEEWTVDSIEREDGTISLTLRQ